MLSWDNEWPSEDFGVNWEQLRLDLEPFIIYLGDPERERGPTLREKIAFAADPEILPKLRVDALQSAFVIARNMSGSRDPSLTKQDRQSFGRIREILLRALRAFRSAYDESVRISSGSPQEAAREYRRLERRLLKQGLTRAQRRAAKEKRAELLSVWGPSIRQQEPWRGKTLGLQTRDKRYQSPAVRHHITFPRGAGVNLHVILTSDSQDPPILHLTEQFGEGQSPFVVDLAPDGKRTAVALNQKEVADALERLAAEVADALERLAASIRMRR
jgi:hypothetical protein